MDGREDGGGGEHDRRIGKGAKQKGFFFGDLDYVQPTHASISSVV